MCARPGATDIVNALHEAPPGVEWTKAAVAERKRLIEETPPGRSPLALERRRKHPGAR